MRVTSTASSGGWISRGTRRMGTTGDSIEADLGGWELSGEGETYGYDSWALTYNGHRTSWTQTVDISRAARKYEGW
jgi:hypothetical protein